jgi:PAS domain S-box-containing protein
VELDFRKAPEILSHVVDAMAVGVFTVDAKGCFAAWSGGAERITGFSSADVVGKPCTLLEGPNCKGFATLAELLGSPTPPPNGICNQECKLMSKDGREIYIHGNVRLIRDEHDQVVGAVGSFTDVTSLMIANDKIAILAKQSATGYVFEELIGNSEPMREVFRQLKLAADSDVTVFIQGESGTGKELAARAVHTQSSRCDKPFLAINCSAIPENLLESELFGHVKGAFTGATADKLGMFEAADGGTLFLDEIGDVSPAVQVKLLRVLQEREIRRIGDNRNRQVDVRVITATNKDLHQLVAAGKIREDFFYRIHVFEVEMPPLRKRKEDIPLLVEQFVNELCKAKGRTIDGVAKDTLDVLMDYHWPGNVRQLRNAIERACVSAVGDRITFLDLPSTIRDPNGRRKQEANQLGEEEAAERARIVEALRQTGGNRTKAAELLGTSRVTLWKKIGRYRIEVR